MSRPSGVILYGPPAAGKDTITKALADMDPRFQLLRKLKAGTGKQDGYRPCSATELDRMDSTGELLYRNARYGNEYAVDAASVDRLVRQGAVPIVHVGQLAGVTAVRCYAAVHWLAVVLWCARNLASSRLVERGDGNAADRMRAWDETQDDLVSTPQFSFDLRIRTDRVSAREAAVAIYQRVRHVAVE
jgi:guanylate kinase